VLWILGIIRHRSHCGTPPREGGTRGGVVLLLTQRRG
jgi:hypothetical protein